MNTVSDIGVESVCESIQNLFELEDRLNPDIPLDNQVPQFSSIDLYSIFNYYGIQPSKLVHAERLTDYGREIIRYVSEKENLGIQDTDVDMRDLLRGITPRHIYRAIEATS